MLFSHLSLGRMGFLPESIMPRYKDTRHGQAGQAATFCCPKYKYLARNQCTQQSATGESASESPLAELRALIALRTKLVSHSSYLFI